MGWNHIRARYILNLEKAKEKARKLEVKGQLDKAIKQYERVLDDLDGKPELADELALFNKLGDLYVKQGNTTAAVDQYEKAITHCDKAVEFGYEVAPEILKEIDGHRR